MEDQTPSQEKEQRRPNMICRYEDIVSIRETATSISNAFKFNVNGFISVRRNGRKFNVMTYIT
jgi:hypothetical protein